MRFNPINIVAYRRKLAKEYLREAEESFKRGDYRRTVESAQLTTENAAKAIVALHHVPSWSHDLSPELLELLEKILKEIRMKAQKLAQIAHELAPEMEGLFTVSLAQWLRHGKFARRIKLKLMQTDL